VADYKWVHQELVVSYILVDGAGYGRILSRPSVEALLVTMLSFMGYVTVVSELSA
jgi:hypothetical protein